ncbi:hypothetical protein CEUSTIGMA_g6615.t1 [Chlamydomonas eustigma]|uniref:PDEase domain-containing protein n=1 Tax=Chlamydomonas eustigma TaxID=1157962 RepID=A0A250X7Y2_9CHLO|nr:hypothetical protein CEUSTIGMA_g6615.t1 [Chlamydomonas eustigma]|eukprot:GAX79175.1 hypothetical protein CEUSTIGMA_g6615.t1 [Chlamydomonas eustigma]
MQASAFALLKEGPLNFLRLMMNPVAANFRKEVINAVLATDMHNHHSIISAFNIKFKPPPPDAQPPLSGLMCKNSCTFSDGNVLMWTLDDDARSLVMQMSLKCADLGAIAADYDIHALWVQRLQEEFHNQGDAEKALGIPVSPLMDRTCVIDALAAVQPQFFKDAALPLFKSFSSVFRDCDQLLINTENNLRRRLEVVFF